MNHYFYWMEQGNGMWMFMGLPVIIIIIVILLIVFFVSTRSARTGRNTEKKNAMKILKQRYAKGEISKKEFSQMKKDIRK